MLHSRRLRRLAQAAVYVAALGGASCTRVGSGESPAGPARAPTPPAETLTHRFEGIATLTGRRVALVLGVRTSGAEVSGATLEIDELGLSAEGGGSWTDARLQLDLRYGGTCPGVLTLRAERESTGNYSGSLRAEDCTGRAEGPLSLRSTAGTGGAAPRRVELPARPE